MGRAMETVDRRALSERIFPTLVAARGAGALSEAGVAAAIASAAEGYSFPTNLDTDPPVGGLAPKTQAELLREAVEGGWTEAELADALDVQDARRRA